MLRYYIGKGHTIEYLLSLSFLEKNFFIDCMEVDHEEEIMKYEKMFGTNNK